MPLVIRILGEERSPRNSSQASDRKNKTKTEKMSARGIHNVYTLCFFKWPWESSLSISLCPNDPERCHRERMWSRYHTGLPVPWQMQLCHLWHHLNLLKCNGSFYVRAEPSGPSKSFCIDKLNNRNKSLGAKNAFYNFMLTFILWHFCGLLYPKVLAFSSIVILYIMLYGE